MLLRNKKKKKKQPGRPPPSTLGCAAKLKRCEEFDFDDIRHPHLKSLQLIRKRTRTRTRTNGNGC